VRVAAVGGDDLDRDAGVLLDPGDLGEQLLAFVGLARLDGHVHDDSGVIVHRRVLLVAGLEVVAALGGRHARFRVGGAALFGL
jgi:hypothetical protein